MTSNPAPRECDVKTTEFTVEWESADPEEADLTGELTPLFSYESSHRYRLEHTEGIDCPCECIGSFGCPISRYNTRAGSLTLEFCASHFDQLQDIVADLRERFDPIDIKRLIHSPTETRHPEFMLVDRSALTHRQLDVLETAFTMGYFDRQREANVSDIASELDLHPSTVSEHLAVAQRKLLTQVL